MQVVDADLISAVRREIAARVGASRYELWFGPTTNLALNGSHAVVWVPNPFFRKWLATHFEADIREAVKTVTGGSPQVHFQVQQVPAVRPKSKSNGEPNGKQPDVRDKPPSAMAPEAPKRRAAAGSEHWSALEDFVVGPCNRLAHAAAMEACRSPAPWHVLVLHGTVGVGKTHLLQGVCRGVAAEGRRRVVYLTAEEFTGDFVAALRGGAMPSFRKRYRGVDVLAVDDVQFFADKLATQEEFLHTLDSIAARRRLVLLGADRPPGLLPFASEALVTRLQAGMSCALEAPDAETRDGLVQAKAARMQLTLPDDVRAWVVETFTASVREIEGALNSLRAYRQLLGHDLELPHAQRVLAHLVRPASRAVSLNDVERAVCGVFGLEPRVLRSAVRQRHVSQPRMLAMFLARKHTRAAYSEIGKFFGGRNHSTVIAAQKKVDRWLTEGNDLHVRHGRWRIDEALAALERELRAG